MASVNIIRKLNEDLAGAIGLLCYLNYGKMPLDFQGQSIEESDRQLLQLFADKMQKKLKRCSSLWQDRISLNQSKQLKDQQLLLPAEANVNEIRQISVTAILEAQTELSRQNKHLLPIIAISSCLQASSAVDKKSEEYRKIRFRVADFQVHQEIQNISWWRCLSSFSFRQTVFLNDYFKKVQGLKLSEINDEKRDQIGYEWRSIYNNEQYRGTLEKLEKDALKREQDAIKKRKQQEQEQEQDARKAKGKKVDSTAIKPLPPKVLRLEEINQAMQFTAEAPAIAAASVGEPVVQKELDKPKLDSAQTVEDITSEPLQSLSVLPSSELSPVVSSKPIYNTHRMIPSVPRSLTSSQQQFRKASITHAPRPFVVKPNTGAAAKLNGTVVSVAEIRSDVKKLYTSVPGCHVEPWLADEVKKFQWAMVPYTDIGKKTMQTVPQVAASSDIATSSGQELTMVPRRVKHRGLVAASGDFHGVTRSFVSDKCLGWLYDIMVSMAREKSLKAVVPYVSLTSLLFPPTEVQLQPSIPSTEVQLPPRASCDHVVEPRVERLAILPIWPDSCKYQDDYFGSYTTTIMPFYPWAPSSLLSLFQEILAEKKQISFQEMMQYFASNSNLVLDGSRDAVKIDIFLNTFFTAIQKNMEFSMESRFFGMDESAIQTFKGTVEVHKKTLAILLQITANLMRLHLHTASEQDIYYATGQKFRELMPMINSSISEDKLSVCKDFEQFNLPKILWVGYNTISNFTTDLLDNMSRMNPDRSQYIHYLSDIEMVVLWLKNKCVIEVDESGIAEEYKADEVDESGIAEYKADEVDESGIAEEYKADEVDESGIAEEYKAAEIDESGIAEEYKADEIDESGIEVDENGIDDSDFVKKARGAKQSYGGIGSWFAAGFSIFSKAVKTQPQSTLVVQCPSPSRVR